MEPSVAGHASGAVPLRPMSTSRAQLAQALTLQQQGRLADAVSLYREVLSKEPRNGDALHLCGLALARMGRVKDAVPVFAAAVSVQPSNPAMLTNLGSALNDLGQHAEAIACFDRAVALKPDIGAAHRGRGIALTRLRRFDPALASMSQALRLMPNDAQVHSDLGVVLESLGRLDEALKCFQRAVALNPRHVEAHHNRALVESALGQHSAALTSLDRALALRPQQPAAHANRGNVLRALGRPAEALLSYDRALAHRADDATVHHNRGMALADLERPADALASFDRALELAPPGAAATHLCRGKVYLQLGKASEALASLERALALDAGEFESHFHHGVALGLLGRHGEAMASYDRAATLKPDSAEVLNNRGVALGRLFRSDEALEQFNQALLRKPDLVEAHTNAGNVLKGFKRFAESAQHFDRAVALKPDDPSATWGQALLKLTLGEFGEGWKLHESRLRLTHMGSLNTVFDRPRWSGAESLEGKTLLVHAEQGLGDTLHFCRYVQLLNSRGAKVLLKVQSVLVPLLRSLEMNGALFDVGEPLPQFDYHCPLLSLPLAFGTNLDSIPGGVPYLRADAERIRQWRDRLATLPGLKIGLNWQGNPDTERQPWIHGRSFALAKAEPLTRVGGVTWISMQKGPGAEQRAQVPFADLLVELQDPFNLGSESMQDTAALVAALDLVITSDTALAHLAGALGVPVWTVLGAVPDWRWLTERADSPWYPTMRLFRQREPNDWDDVFKRVAAELNDLVGERTTAVAGG
jgi:tetratricopeptide (TPR) repeat protein